MIEPIYLIMVGVVVYVLLMIALLSRYRRCPAGKILVVCGVTTPDGIRCLNRGGVFIWPFPQEYSYLSLTPVILGAEHRDAMSGDDMHLDASARMSVAISTEPELMPNAAKHLLNASEERIQSLAHDILLAQLRRLLATTSMDGFSAFRNKFLDTLQENVETELNKLGLHIVSIDLTQVRTKR